MVLKGRPTLQGYAVVRTPGCTSVLWERCESCLPNKEASSVLEGMRRRQRVLRIVGVGMVWGCIQYHKYPGGHTLGPVNDFTKLLPSCPHPEKAQGAQIRTPVRSPTFQSFWSLLVKKKMLPYRFPWELGLCRERCSLQDWVKSAQRLASR